MRLIDADALMHEINRDAYGMIDPKDGTILAVPLDHIVHEIEDALTIEPSEQVTGKLKNPCDSLLADDKDDSKEQKIKLDLISREDVPRAINNFARRFDKGKDEYQMFTYSELAEIISSIPSIVDTIPSAESTGKLDDVINKYIEDGYMLPPSADRPKGEWIPCSERLPDIKEYHVSDPCLVYCENGAYVFAELEENIFGQVGWDCEREDEYHELLGEVLAWMPLPKPYTGGDTE